MRSLQGSLLALAGLIALGAGCAEEKASLGARDASAMGGGGSSDAGKSDAGGGGGGNSDAGKSDAGGGGGSEMCSAAHSDETADDIADGASDDAACGSEGDIAAVCSNAGATETATCATASGYMPAAAKTCLMEALPDLSDGCADCFIATMSCAVSMCSGECIADATSEACLSCRQEKCTGAFYDCAGLRNPSE